MTTMLQLVQQATAEMGLDIPTLVAASANKDTIQQLALLNAVGYELQREYDWEALNTEYSFNTVYYTYTGTTTNGSTSVTGMSSIVGLDSTFSVTGTGINQNTYIVSAASTTVVLSQAATATGTVSITFSQTKYTMPSDFDRQIDRTHWDKSMHWEIVGPETAQEWQWLKSGFISTGPRERYRILGGYFQIWPALGAAHLLGFEYVSKKWAATTAAVAKTSFTIDTDTCIFPDRLMVLGLKLKYFQIKGFDTSSFQRDYDMQLSIAKSNDSGSKTLSFAPRLNSILLSQENIPDSGYGS